MKRGKPLQRRTPIARKTRMKQRRATRRRESRVRDKQYLREGHRRRCCARDIPGHRCSGPIEMDHVGPRGKGQKSHDPEAIPVCQGAHRARTDHHGLFWNMPLADELVWRRKHIAIEQTDYYGRPLSAADLDVVRATVEAGGSTRGLFAAQEVAA